MTVKWHFSGGSTNDQCSVVWVELGPGTCHGLVGSHGGVTVTYIPAVLAEVTETLKVSAEVGALGALTDAALRVFQVRVNLQLKHGEVGLNMQW